MRTTLTIDDDVLRAARALATARGLSLGAALSELARRGLEPGRFAPNRADFPVFPVGDATAPFGPDEVAKALDGYEL